MYICRHAKQKQSGPKQPYEIHTQTLAHKTDAPSTLGDAAFNTCIVQR